MKLTIAVQVATGLPVHRQGLGVSRAVYMTKTWRHVGYVAKRAGRAVDAYDRNNRNLGTFRTLSDALTTVVANA